MNKQTNKEYNVVTIREYVSNENIEEAKWIQLWPIKEKETREHEKEDPEKLVSIY